MMIKKKREPERQLIMAQMIMTMMTMMTMMVDLLVPAVKI